MGDFRRPRRTAPEARGAHLGRERHDTGADRAGLRTVVSVDVEFPRAAAAPGRPSPDADPWHDSNRPRIRIDQVLRRAARRQPDALALVDGAVRRTYRVLDADVDAFAAVLRRAGVTRGTRVAVSVPTGIRAVVTLYGLARVGAVGVPLNEMWSWHETLDVLTRSEVVRVLADPERARDGSALAEALARVEAGRRPALGVLTGPTEVRWSLDPGPIAPAGSDDTAAEPAGPDDVALLLFTSGSTSAPKGALLTHAGIVGSTHYLALACELGPQDRFVNALPAYHVGGIVDGFLLIHMVGGACFPLRFDPERILELCATEGVTFISGFDGMFSSIFNAPGYSRGRHPAWRVALSSVKDEEYDRLRQAGVERVITGFGMTETCSNWATTRLTQSEEARRASRWLPYPGVEVVVVDLATGRPAAPGQIGELRVRGWNVTVGYLDGTSGKDADGFFRTGDLGRSHDDGTVSFAGRIKGMIKTGGENVVAHEVEETVLREVEDVRTAVVVGIPDERWGEMVVAFVELEPGSELEAEEIRERCRGSMASYKVPKRFFRVDPGSWPLMPAGKLDRPALTARAAELLRDAAAE